MNHIRQIVLILLLILPLALLVLVRTKSPHYFKHNAAMLGEASFSHSNTMTIDQIKAISSNYLVVSLDNDVSVPEGIPGHTVTIPYGALLDKTSLRKIRSHEGPTLLYSEDAALAAKAWMLLAQMGFKNLFILTGRENNEAPKHSFRPDSVHAGVR